MIFKENSWGSTQHHAKTGDTALICRTAQSWGGVSSTIGSGYFAPYYPTTHHPCSTLVFSFNCTLVQLLLYTSSAAIVHQFSCNGTSSSSAFCHPFHVYIEGLVPYRINRVLILLIRFNRIPTPLPRS